MKPTKGVIMINPVRHPVKFVRRHKVAIAIVTTAAICIAINRQALGQHNDFLKEIGQYEAFHTWGM
jgi:hypothetical protein